MTSAEGNQYLSLIENNLAHTPPTDGTDSVYWACYARAGPQGIQGDPGGESGLWAMQEVPTGVQDGVNKTFTLHHTPTGTVTVIFNGIICQNGVDYSYSGIDLTLITFAPDAADDDKFFVWYPYYGITALLSFGDIAWQGAWNSGTTYTIGQGVTSSGHGYVSIQDSNLNHAVSEAAWWVEVGSNGMEYVTSPVIVDHADVSPVDLGLAPENSIVEPIIRCIESSVDCVLVIGDESDADSLCINASMPIAVTDPPIEGPMGKQYYSAEKYLRATITTPGTAGKWSIQFRITLVS